MDKDNRVGIDCGSASWGRGGREEQWEKIETTEIEQQQKKSFFLKEISN